LGSESNSFDKVFSEMGSGDAKIKASIVAFS
jgi:hypothetical protein